MQVIGRVYGLMEATIFSGTLNNLKRSEGTRKKRIQYALMALRGYLQ